MLNLKTKYSFLFLVLILGVLPLKAEPWGSPANPRERIYLFTDRDLYVAGENLFFNLTLFAEPALSGKSSGFAYLVLRNENGIIQRLTLKLSDFQAQGNLFLPDTLSSGYYELIAFTNWMRNAGEAWYFRKSLFIANRFDTRLEALFPPAGAEPRLNFFPEGGNLISGISNRALMLVEGPFDPSLREITLLSEVGDTLAQTQLNKHGWATFDFIPPDSMEYFALVDGVTDRYPLPLPSPDGVGLKVEQMGLELNVSIGICPKTEFHGRLQIIQNTMLKKDLPLSIHSDETLSVSIPHDELPVGLFHFVVEGSSGEELARRYWYHGQPPVQLGFSIDKRFTKREQVYLEIENPVQPGISPLQVSIARREAFQDNAPSLPGWLAANELAMFLKLQPEKACEVFGPLSPENVNHRLIGFVDQGNFDFNKAPDRNGFYMETGQLIVSGKVIQSLDGKPLPNVRVILNTPDTLVNLRYSLTNSEGEFQFLLDGYYNNRSLVFTADPKTYNGLIDIEVYDKFELEIPFQPRWFTGLASKKEYLLQAQEVLRVNKAFESGNLGSSLIPEQYVYRAPRLFAQPLITLRTDDYEPLEDLREITRELIHPWRIRQSSKGYRHIMVSANERKQMEGEPVLFVDGIITFKIEPLLELNSSTLREIQIHNTEWMYGEMYFPGIVALFTRNNLWKELELRPQHKVIFHEAPEIPGRFLPVSHDSDTNQIKKPDLRDLLFWSPGINVRRDRNTLLSFFTSDLGGEYLLNIQGLDPEGRAILFQKVFIVNP